MPKKDNKIITTVPDASRLTPSDTAHAPLAERMRPKIIDDIIGQKSLLGANGIVRQMTESGHLSNLLLWGPPGCGKT
ncbi:MAG: hypothetical protein FWE17_01015, partial [Alphaproteobacteria bacterium]|nr:hypothetical protein [Alphaproteobacteria bacterium]